MAPILLNHLCEVFLDQVSSLGNNFCWNHSAVRKWLTGCVIENDGLSQPVGAQASQMSLYRSHLLNAKCRSLQLILSWRICCTGFEALTWLFRDLRLAETSSLRGVLGVTAPGTTSVSSRRICLRSPPSLWDVCSLFGHLSLPLFYSDSDCPLLAWITQTASLFFHPKSRRQLFCDARATRASSRHFGTS